MRLAAERGPDGGASSRPGVRRGGGAELAGLLEALLYKNRVVV